MTIDSVTCPANLKPASGVAFQCQVTGSNGVSGSVTVTPTDAQGQKFTFKAKLKGNGFTQDSSGNATIG